MACHRPARPPALPQVRVGSPAKVRPELRGACLDAQVERTAAGQRAARLRERADAVLARLREEQALQARRLQYAQDLQAKGGQLTPDQAQQLQAQQHAIRAMRREADAMWREADVLVKEAAVDVLRSAPVRAGVAAAGVGANVAAWAP